MLRKVAVPILIAVAVLVLYLTDDPPNPDCYIYEQHDMAEWCPDAEAPPNPLTD